MGQRSGELNGSGDGLPLQLDEYFDDEEDDVEDDERDRLACESIRGGDRGGLPGDKGPDEFVPRTRPSPSIDFFLVGSST